MEQIPTDNNLYTILEFNTTLEYFKYFVENQDRFIDAVQSDDGKWQAYFKSNNTYSPVIKKDQVNYIEAEPYDGKLPLWGKLSLMHLAVNLDDEDWFNDLGKRKCYYKINKINKI